MIKTKSLETFYLVGGQHKKEIINSRIEILCNSGKSFSIELGHRQNTTLRDSLFFAGGNKKRLIQLELGISYPKETNYEIGQFAWQPLAL